MKIKILASTLISMSLFQPPAFSESPAGSVYFGGSVGKSEMTDNGDIESDTSKFHAGWQLDNNFAIEVEWIRMEDFEFDDFDFVNDIEGDSINMSAVYMMPLGENFEIMAKGGLHYTEFDFEGFDTEESGVSLGLGGVYNFAPNFGIRAEYQKLFNATEVNDDFDLYSLGVSFRF